MTPASAAPTETPSPRPRPLYHLATVAILTPLANCTLTARNVWEQVASLATGSPYHNPLEHLDILHLGLLAMAAWSVIRRCDAAYDNLLPLENHHLPDSLHALYWLIPVLQLFLPGMGMAALSRRSNTERDPTTGEGQALASILPWAILSTRPWHCTSLAPGAPTPRPGWPRPPTCWNWLPCHSCSTSAPNSYAATGK